MSGELISVSAFVALISVLTGGVGGVWVLYEARNLARALRRDGRDPLVRDQRVGHLTGLIIGLLGVIGTLRFHDVV
jgi:hypothetical protein